MHSERARDRSSLEPKLGIFSVLSGNEERQQGTGRTSEARLDQHALVMGTLSPASPDVLRSRNAADQATCQGAASEIAHPPLSMSPPQPMYTNSPPLLPGATAAAEISQPESPCNIKGSTMTTGVVRGRITIPPRILASQVSDNSPRILARGRSLPTNRKQQGALPLTFEWLSFALLRCAYLRV